MRPKGLTTAACFLQNIEGIKSVASCYCLKNDVCHTPSTASRNVVVGTAAVTVEPYTQAICPLPCERQSSNRQTYIAQPHLQQRMNDTMRCTIHCC